MLYEPRIGPASTLSWPELLTLLQAGHNPRFSRTLNNAHYQIINGGNGDSFSLIGGFPYVVRTALPNAPDIMRSQDLGTNVTVEAVLGEYIRYPSANNWNGVLRILHNVAPTAHEQGWLVDTFPFFVVWIYQGVDCESTLLSASGDGRGYGYYGIAG